MTAPPAEPAPEPPSDPAPPPGGANSPPTDPPGPPAFHLDGRLYALAPRDWRAHVKVDFAKQYCHLKSPGEDYYHLLTGGELFLENGEAKLCLNCAVRSGVLSTDRRHWQRGDAAPTRITALPDGEVGL